MTEREALRIVQEMGAGETNLPGASADVIADSLQALATLTLANRIHMQQLKDRCVRLEAWVEEEGGMLPNV